MKILLVDDAQAYRQLLALQLEQSGYEIIHAENGQEALEVLDESSDIRFVISDWMMPVMDGVEFCQKTRNRNYDYYIYFILLTGRNDKESVLEGLEIGADDFLPKPVDLDELKVRIKAGSRIVDLESRLNKNNEELSNALDTVHADLQAAALMLNSLLPTEKVLKNLEMEWSFKPSSTIGGDMFGYKILTKDIVQFYQVDVAGHGIPSALMSFTLHYFMDKTDERFAETQTLISPDEFASELNERFQSDAESMLYFTMVYGYLNTSTGEVSLVQAGHPPPLLVSAVSASATFIGDGGFPVAMIPNATFETTNFQLQKGDQLILYSDGVTECENNQGEQFSEERLIQLVNETSKYQSENIVENIQMNIEEWAGSNCFDDDVSLLSICWRGN